MLYHQEAARCLTARQRAVQTSRVDLEEGVRPEERDGNNHMIILIIITLVHYININYNYISYSYNTINYNILVANSNVIINCIKHIIRDR